MMDKINYFSWKRLLVTCDKITAWISEHTAHDENATSFWFVVLNLIRRVKWQCTITMVLVLVLVAPTRFLFHWIPTKKVERLSPHILRFS